MPREPHAPHEENDVTSKVTGQKPWMYNTDRNLKKEQIWCFSKVTGFVFFPNCWIIVSAVEPLFLSFNSFTLSQSCSRWKGFVAWDLGSEVDTLRSETTNSCSCGGGSRFGSHP
uniref:Uncharacterized protein n=1 Tax=Knipowitschia caucasica TaxID=637954 RepID=A0AAV2K797_KNICA